MENLFKKIHKNEKFKIIKKYEFFQEVFPTSF